MIALFAPNSPHRKSPLVLGLLLIGSVTWLSPMVAAARRPRPPEQSSAPREIVLPLASTTGDVCVQGTSIAGEHRYTVIDGRVVRQGEQIRREGTSFRVVKIEAESVRLHAVPKAELVATPVEQKRH